MTSPDTLKPLDERTHARFVAKYEVADNGCWEWTACRMPRGYGKFGIGGFTYLAHRVSYRHHVGEIPVGLHLDHLCRNTSCVNPDHLEAVTERENIMRGTGPTAVNACRVRCVNGHLMLGRDLYVYPDGKRKCLACKREDRQESRAPGKGAEEVGRNG